MLATIREFGDYVDLEEVGQGSFGIVYKGWHRQLGRPAAIKILREECADAERNKAFLDEACRAAALKDAGSPYVAAVYNSSVIDERAYIASEYVEGQTLEAWLADQRRRGKQPAIDDAARIVEGIARGLAHAHAHRIAHHDIKPGNIILRDEELAPVIVDFGSGATLGAAARLGCDWECTPRYMAPEQALGTARPFSPESDVYSLGLVMYELLAGQPAFASCPVEAGNGGMEPRAAAEQESLRKHFFSVPARPRSLRPDIPVALERLCLRCLEPNSAKRSVTAHDIAAGVAAWRARRRLVAVAKRPWPWAAVAACVSLLLAMTAFSHSDRQKPFGKLMYRDIFERAENSDVIWERAHPAVTKVTGPTLLLPEVKFEDGLAVFTNRGFLISRSEFPDGVSTRLRWMHVWGTGTYCDHLTVGLRTSGKMNSVWSHELEDGILVRFVPASGTISIIDAPTFLNIQACRGVGMERCAWHDIQVVDDGRTISVFIDDMVRPKIAAELPDTSRQHRVAIYNREVVGHVNKQSVIDHVEIWAPRRISGIDLLNPP